MGTSDAPLRLPTPPPALRRIVLRLPNWLGDVVMAAPAVAAIGAARPEAELIAQARPALLSLAALLPGISRAVPAGAERVGDLRAGRRLLRGLEADAVVLFPRSLRAALVPWLARVPVRVGYARGARPRLLTHGVAGWRAWRSGHRSAWFGLLARALGAEVGLPWRLDPPPAARAAADSLLADLGLRGQGPLVALEPGARYGPAKCWPAERFGELAARLLAAGCDVVTVGTAESRALEDTVARAAGPGLLRAGGRTPDLVVLAALLARCALVVSNDTGPMHLAAAVATPVLGLFGATDPVVSGPLGLATRQLVYDPEPCSPCFLRTCPVPGHPCLSKLGVGRIERLVHALLASAPHAADSR